MTDHPEPRSRLAGARLRCAAGISAALLVPLGLGSKHWSGPGAEWVWASAGDLLVVVFLCCCVRAAAPRVRPGLVALAVVVFSFALELLQLWRPPWLEALRGSTLGDLTLGSTFDAHDLIWYTIGGAVGWGALRLLDRRFGAAGDDAEA